MPQLECRSWEAWGRGAKSAKRCDVDRCVLVSLMYRMRYISLHPDVLDFLNK